MAQLNGVWTDLIDEFLLYTENYMSSEIHRTWSAITMVGGACERRLWIDVGDYENYANLYVFLVAPPGHGKGIIEVVRDLWTHTPDLEQGGGNGSKANGKEGPKAFHVSPDNVSRASLIDNINEAKTIRILKKNPLKDQSEKTYIYHTLLVPAEEFEVLLPTYDPSFMSVLNGIWNNKASHSETRRHGPAKEVTIPNPQLTILGGVQPAYFISHFPEYAWDTGLARRIVMIYSDVMPEKDIWTKTIDRNKIREHILQRLGQIAMMYGRIRITKEAEELIRDWHNKGGPPKPTHSKLAHYNTTRSQMLVKLAMISAVSRTASYMIEVEDTTRALKWLLEAERRMPDIFRAMTGKSDKQVLEELHLYVIEKYRMNKGKPVEGKDVYTFLAHQTTSDKIASLVTLAERAQYMIKVLVAGNECWLPKPKAFHGVE